MTGADMMIGLVAVIGLPDLVVVRSLVRVLTLTPCLDGAVRQIG
jgi:hypothetical protein